MDPRQKLQLRRLAERVLGGGGLPLPLLLEVLVPAQRLRALARKLGLSPRGGFRADRAPANVLAPMLAELKEPTQLDEVLGTLLLAVQAEPEAEADTGVFGTPPAEASPDLAPVLRFKEQELERTRAELERARQGGTRALDRESELRRELEARDEESQRLRAEVARLQRPSTSDADHSRADAERLLQSQIRELEQEITARDAADQALRHQLAQDHSRLRQLEEDKAALEQLVPKGRRRKKTPEPPPPERRFLLPYFLPSFYRSLDGKDRRSVERAMQAVLLFCTEGHGYPGLEVKHLGGQEAWSLRASLGLRLYFRHREDGDIELLELADREEQNTTLRRLKDR